MKQENLFLCLVREIPALNSMSNNWKFPSLYKGLNTFRILLYAIRMLRAENLVHLKKTRLGSVKCRRFLKCSVRLLDSEKVDLLIIYHARNSQFTVNILVSIYRNLSNIRNKYINTRSTHSISRQLYHSKSPYQSLTVG